MGEGTPSILKHLHSFIAYELGRPTESRDWSRTQKLDPLLVDWNIISLWMNLWSPAPFVSESLTHF